MKTRLYYLPNKKKNQVISLNLVEDTIKYVKFCFLTSKTEVVNIFLVTMHEHIFRPYRQITVCFLTHTEWPPGNASLFSYLQIGDRYYNTDFVDVCIQPVKVIFYTSNFLFFYGNVFL